MVRVECFWSNGTCKRQSLTRFSSTVVDQSWSYSVSKNPSLDQSSSKFSVFSTGRMLTRCLVLKSVTRYNLNRVPLSGVFELYLNRSRFKNKRKTPLIFVEITTSALSFLRVIRYFDNKFVYTVTTLEPRFESYLVRSQQHAILRKI